MGLVEIADAAPPLPRQLVVAAASFICWGRPAVHFTEQVHQCQGVLDGGGDIRSRLAAFFALSHSSDPPPRHNASHGYWVHRDSVCRFALRAIAAATSRGLAVEALG